VKRKVKVDLGALAYALEMDPYGPGFYLDVETGHIVTVEEETHWQLSEIHEEIYEPDGTPICTLEAYLEAWDGPDWQKRALLEAEQVEAGRGERYIPIRQDDRHADYDDMARFVAQVEDPNLRERLEEAIRGKGAFGRFKRLVRRYPALKEPWVEFKKTRLQQRCKDWLSDHDIEPLA
jgi:hypothetical protein